jgi:hypothetical protein
METVHQSFIHVTPVAEAHLSNASPFQTPLITPRQQTDQTNNQGTISHCWCFDCALVAGALPLQLGSSEACEASVSTQ